ncbi:MAG: hypothetical protein QNJ46_11400 [Leptolyngbyaceae cyanobacterium MO_188.B28]|nr:hypothetical protein [Leptolyngbyaceae cyanobacterium MO_188.B28]
MNIQSTHYEELQQTVPGKSRPLSGGHHLSNYLQALFGSLIRVLAPTESPIIREVRTLDGQTQFNAYDPLTNQRIRRASEEEIRVWLEQRYYSKRGQS